MQVSLPGLVQSSKNSESGARMRIVVDIQAYQSPYSQTRGVGRYTKNLVEALLKRARGHEVYLALNGAYPDKIEAIRAEFSSLVPQDRFLVWQNHMKTQFSYDRELNPPSEELVRSAEVVREVLLNSVQPDIIFSPNMQEGFSDPAVTSVRRIPSQALYATTLHDLTPMHFEEDLLTDEVVRKWYFEKIEYAKNSDLVITDSQASCDDIAKLLNVSRRKIFPILLGYDPDVFSADGDLKIDRGICKKLKIPSNFIFYFGGNDRCKNIDRLLEAYSVLTAELRTKFPLVLGGGSFKYDPYGGSHVETTRLIEALGIASNVLRPGFISDDYLPHVLRSCTCFVFPSTHEGFGLPALEAMACGAPVIGSNRSSVGEVIENKAALFDPYDVKSMASMLEKVVSDAKFRSRLRESGLKRAGDFSWEKAAGELLDAFERAHGAHKKLSSGSYVGEPVREAMTALAPYSGALRGAELSALARSLDETFPPSGKPTIYVDISTVVFKDDASGIQRVTRAVAGGLLADAPAGFDVELVHSAPDRTSFYVANAYKAKTFGIGAASHDTYVAFKPGDILLFLDQAPRMAINHRAYTQYLRSIGVRVYFYVHDLIPLQHPEWFSKGGGEEFGELMETVALSDGAICNSGVTALDVKEYVKTRLTPARLPFYIAAAHLGMDIKGSAPSTGLPDDAEEVLAKLRSRTSFLMIGTLEPRKGHRQMLAAFERLWEQGIDANLVIVGRWGWKMGSFDETLRAHSQWGERLFWLTGISDEFLEQVYGASDCLIAASEAEGFGLPLIEAANHSLPVIARDIPVFREVAAQHAVYFPATSDAADAAQTIGAWIEAYKRGEHISSEGMQTSSWQECVRKILDAMIGDKWLYKLDARAPGNAP